jgi:hypothetical protein
MQKIPKQEYTTEFKERAVKHVKEGKSIGLLRAKVKIGMMNLVYNMMRLVQLIKRDRIGGSAIWKAA